MLTLPVKTYGVVQGRKMDKEPMQLAFRRKISDDIEGSLYARSSFKLGSVIRAYYAKPLLVIFMIMIIRVTPAERARKMIMVRRKLLISIYTDRGVRAQTCSRGGGEFQKQDRQRQYILQVFESSGNPRKPGVLSFHSEVFLR